MKRALMNRVKAILSAVNASSSTKDQMEILAANF